MEVASHSQFVCLPCLPLSPLSGSVHRTERTADMSLNSTVSRHSHSTCFSLLCKSSHSGPQINTCPYSRPPVTQLYNQRSQYEELHVDDSQVFEFSAPISSPSSTLDYLQGNCSCVEASFVQIQMHYLVNDSSEL